MSEMGHEFRNKPDREPDIVLPSTAGATQVWVWVKENVFSYNGHCWNAVQSNNNTIRHDVFEYLEYTIVRHPNTERAQVAMDYLAEMELLHER